MPINPCGRRVDFARREYKTKCRFFKDSNVEVEIQWIRCAEDAPDLGFPNSFMSIDWLDEQYDQPQDAEIGEVWGEDRPYSFHAPLVGLKYDHVCGTEEEFLNGVAFDEFRDVKYDEQGLPLCCHGPITPSMGVVVGLEVEVTSEVPPGATCDEAPLVAVGVVMATSSTAPGGGIGWWKIPATAGQVLRFVTITGDRYPDHLGQVVGGTDCASPMFNPVQVGIDPMTVDVTMAGLGITHAFVKLDGIGANGPKAFVVTQIT